MTCWSFQDHQWIRGPNILLWLLLLLDSRKGFQYPFGSSELTCWLSSKEITKNSVLLLCFKEIFKMRCYTPVNNIVQSFTYWEKRPYNFSLYYTTEYDVSINCWLWQKSLMLDDTVEPLALLDPLEEGWEIFVKKWSNRLKIFYFLFEALTTSKRFKGICGHVG